jgi:hypothetical protein
VVPLEHLADLGRATDAGHAELVMELGVLLTPFEEPVDAVWGAGKGRNGRFSEGFGRQSKVELHA